MREFPRRINVTRWAPAELAIWEAVQAVERLPPDNRLTRSVTLLQQARELVADYLDDHEPKSAIQQYFEREGDDPPNGAELEAILRELEGVKVDDGQVTRVQEGVLRASSPLGAHLPPHKCGLYLTHNEHKNYYETVERWESLRRDAEDWVSPEERERAIQTGEVWSLQWYPDTPVGCYLLLASSLEALLAAVDSGGDQG